MKKLLVITLVLVMLLGLAAPAFAYTTNVDTGTAGRYKMELSLVEYDTTGDVFTGMFKLKPNNRAYAKNEIVAALAKITIPKNGNIVADGYSNLQLKAKNLSFNVVENNRVAGGFNLMTTVPNANWGGTAWKDADEYTSLSITLNDPTGAPPHLPISKSSKTYAWLVFGKVTNDNAKLTFQSVKQVDFTDYAVNLPNNAFGNLNGGTLVGGAPSKYLVLNDGYIVVKQGTNYLVFENAERNGSYDGSTYPRGDLLFRIDTGRAGRTERLYMFTRDYNGPIYRVVVEPSRKELDFFAVGTSVRNKKAGDQIDPTSSDYRKLKAFYQEHFEDGLNFSAYNEGNIMLDSDWVKISDKTNLKASVDLEPWVPYPTR